MVAKRSSSSNPSVIEILEVAESHVNPYINNAYTDHAWVLKLACLIKYVGRYINY